MSITNTDVPKIAQGLRVREKLQVPTLLFLGARAGALFHSEVFYDILSPFSQHPFATLNQTEKFQSCIRLLEDERFTDADIHAILAQSLQDPFIQNIDRYVAPLVKYHFCQLIATTNLDLGLEAALSRIGLHIHKDFEVFIPDAQSSGSVPSLSTKQVEDGYPLCTLVKLYGELYSLKNRKELFAGDVQRYQQLQNMRNWNILMVGFDPVWDAAIVNILLPCAGKLWYVNEERPPDDDPVFKYLQHHNAQCLLGEEGNSEIFFRSLHRHIFGSTPLPAFTPQVEHRYTQSRQPLFSVRDVEQSIDRTKSTSPPQYKVDVLIIATAEHELNAVLKQQEHANITSCTIQGRISYDLGKVGDASVFLIQADGLDTLGEQIRELSPACIIILGMAWGFNYKGQSIGAVLVPDRILIYDTEQENRNSTLTKKSGTDSQLQIGRRRKAVSTQLLNLFKNGSIILNKKTRRLVLVTFGLIFSSTTEIDRQTAFRTVSKTAPDAIGIETGGAKLFSLAQRYQENSLVVNGVSALIDVDEKSDKELADPERALNNAAQFILNVIVLGGFHNAQAR
jgi:nucleoside phosphorylase